MSTDGEVVGTAEVELLARMPDGELINVGQVVFDVIGPSLGLVMARDEHSEPSVAAAQDTGGAPVDSDPARPSGDVCAAIVATLRHVAAVDFHADQQWAQMWYDAATNVELAGADRDVCPLCEEVACDDDCALAPYRNADYRAS